MTYAIVLAGGTGTRLGGNVPKQYLEINGKPIIAFCLETFEKHEKIDKIVIVAADEWQAYIRDVLKKFCISTPLFKIFFKINCYKFMLIIQFFT